MSEFDPEQGDLVASYWSDRFMADPVQAAAELANSVYEQRQAEQAQSLNEARVAHEAARLLDESQKFQREQEQVNRQALAIERVLARQDPNYESHRDAFFDHVTRLPPEATAGKTFEQMPEWFVDQYKTWKHANDPDRSAWERVKAAGERRYWDQHGDEHLKDIRGR